MTLYTNEWSNHEFFNDSWKVRIKLLSELIDTESKIILDLGCGKEWLKEFLPDDKIYYGCDYVGRSENTIVCDFNKKEFPDIQVDVCFISGCLEYIYDWKWFLSKVAKSCSYIVMSYITIENEPDMKKRKLWVNHIPNEKLIKYVESLEFKLIHMNKKARNQLYKFKRM